MFILNKLKKCSICSNVPKLHIRNYAKTMNDNTIVPHYMYQCDICQLKYINIEGVCVQTLEWHSEEMALVNWNEIVDNKNSYYTKEYQKLHPLQITLF